MSLDTIETYLIEIISRSNDVVTKQTASKALGELGRLRVNLISPPPKEEPKKLEKPKVGPPSGPPQPAYTTTTVSLSKNRSAYKIFYEEQLKEPTDLSGRELSKDIHTKWINLSPEDKKLYKDMSAN